MRTAPSRRALRPLVAATAAALLLAACSTGGAADGDGATASPSADGAAFPVTLTNAFGETTVESEPTAVATVNWGNHDVPIALGIVPVGFAGSTYGDDDADGVLPWTFEALEKLGATGDDLPVLFDETDGIAFESVANTEPDVVLAAYSGLTQEDWTTLQQIAPTVSWPEFAWGTNWKDMALVNGRALGREAEAQEIVDDVLAQIEDALAERPDVEGTTIAYTWIDPADLSTIGVYTPLDARVQLLEDLGMKVAPSVVELAGDTEEFFVNLASEQADALSDVDVLVTYGDDSTLATLQADPLLNKIPAVARGSVVVVPDGAPLSSATSGPTVLSVPWALDAYLDLFQAAAAKVG
ncbi:iron-siderophore ABC transporter substrate-binding protein [Cellulomonas xiejunii]|uniref:Iron-siderophore ABC transporter substrate-binding protein n=1 Tax=Cellulomonas xiejunii TaxID=2968083 RepID=A0ABY5KLR8_9CELL|nr:iron-siderophore ABC transporter substrate-binding protein [Cellulomonas xiejunii]MCC2320422.1 iron-siderophore ABC transporter substrate-binding protein [Cellulomonas xiejunii]UUI70719.1 iron-siderophore ABC transporter substrate-binding protein [Cellulomonas xiejunii]